MGRILAGIASCLLLLAGGVILFSSRAATSPFPAAPTPRLAATSSAVRLSPIGQAPSADPQSKAEKRFARADKNEDGKITLAELVEPRRKAFARLDLDQDGKLSFEEWAVKTIDKYKEANADGDGWLNPTEYAATAPKVKPKPACGCS